MFTNPTLIDIGDSILAVFVIIVIIIDISSSERGYAFVVAIFTFLQIAVHIKECFAVVALIKSLSIIFISAKWAVLLSVIFIDFFAAFRTFHHDFTLDFNSLSFSELCIRL